MRKEIVLLTFLKYGNILGRKRFQKLVFLAKYKYGAGIPFIFVNYKYGPYSRELQDVLDGLVMAGFVEEVKRISDGFVEYEYRLTGKGRFLVGLFPLSRSDEEAIRQVMDEYGNKPTREVVEEAYKVAGLKPPGGRSKD